MTAAIDPRERMAALSLEIRSLEAEYQNALTDLIDDLKFQDIPIQRIGYAAAEMATLHLVETTYENDDRRAISYHNADGCDVMWCDADQPSRRVKWGRKGQGVWKTFLGVWEVVARSNEYVSEFDGTRATLFVIPEGAIQARRVARETVGVMRVGS